MDADAKKKILIPAVAILVIAAVRIGFMVYERRDTGAGPKKPETTYSSNMDDYVTPHKIFRTTLNRPRKSWWGSQCG